MPTLLGCCMPAFHCDERLGCAILLENCLHTSEHVESWAPPALHVTTRSTQGRATLSRVCVRHLHRCSTHGSPGQSHTSVAHTAWLQATTRVSLDFRVVPRSCFFAAGDDSIPARRGVASLTRPQAESRGFSIGSYYLEMGPTGEILTGARCV